jgi:hypothetical protein
VNIRKSSARHVRECIAELSAPDRTTRESAIARLTVIGTRAVSSLAEVVADKAAPAAAREGALQALEGIGGPRSLATALDTVDDPNPSVAVAAIGVARSQLTDARGLPVVDRLTAVVFDRARPAAVRLAAVRALSDLPLTTLQPVYSALQSDPTPEIAAFAKSGGIKTAGESIAPEAAPDLLADPSALRHRLAASPSALPLQALHDLLEQIRKRETSEPVATRAQWTTARGAVHAALASRNSRVALYDLRETVQQTREPLPVDFLAALETIGDASCLEAIAEAYTRASGASGGAWWTRHLSEAFHAITTRERITRRNAVMKRIETRWPAILGGPASTSHRRPE